MATKYNLPQFSTTPTPAYQQQPIIKLPNYAEIYARSFAYGQQAATEAFRPIRAEIEKIQARKERDRLEKKADEERLLRKEENISKDVSNYQKLIFDKITKDGAGDFEGEIENMLMKNVDGFAANERAYKIEQNISAENYNKMRAFYFKEINDMKLSSQALKDNLDWDAQNSERYSRYNNAEFPGLIESLKQGEAKLGRTKTGDLAIIYSDALDKEASFLVKDLKNLRAQDNINLKLDFSNESDIGYQSHVQLEAELNQQGIIGPASEIRKQVDAVNGITTQTKVTEFTADQKEQAIKYIVNQSATMRNLMESGTGVAGKYYLDNMLYADNMGETGADIKVRTLAKKYFQSKNIVPSAIEFDKVENLLETYNEEYLSDPLQNEVKEFQDEQIKLNYAENLWNTKFAIKEKEEEVVRLIDENATIDNEVNNQKIAYSQSLEKAIVQGNNIIEKMNILQEDKDTYPAGYINGITRNLNNFFGIDYSGRTLEVVKDEVTINNDGKVNIVYKLPEDIFGKQENLEVSSDMDIKRLHGIRNSLYGNWAAGIQSDVLIVGLDDYRSNKDTDAAKYYAETIQGFGGALVSKEDSSPTPTTTTEIKEEEYPEEFNQLSTEPIEGKRKEAMAEFGLLSTSAQQIKEYKDKFGADAPFTQQNIAKLAFDRKYGNFTREKYNAQLKKDTKQKTSKQNLQKKYQDATTEKANTGDYEINNIKKLYKKYDLGPFPGTDNFTKKDLAFINYLEAGFKKEDLEINRDYE